MNLKVVSRKDGSILTEKYLGYLTTVRDYGLSVSTGDLIPSETGDVAKIHNIIADIRRDLATLIVEEGYATPDQPF